MSADMNVEKPQKKVPYAAQKEKRPKSIKPEIVKHMHKLRMGLRTS